MKSCVKVSVLLDCLKKPQDESPISLQYVVFLLIKNRICEM